MSVFLAQSLPLFHTCRTDLYEQASVVAIVSLDWWNNRFPIIQTNAKIGQTDQTKKCDVSIAMPFGYFAPRDTALDCGWLTGVERTILRINF